MSLSDWQVPPDAQPRHEDYTYDLEAALAAVVSLRAIVPADAFTAESLGTERLGNGVFIREGVVLTIGYLITEAETIWITLSDGQVVPGHALAYDQASGFGLVQALARLEQPGLELATSAKAPIGEQVVVAAAGGCQRSVAARIVGKQEFAGYWEYVLDEAIFTAPAHPHWGGTAVLSPKGEVLGVGSLQLQTATESSQNANLNMVVPIDLLKPILGDMLKFGRPNRPPRPWMGLFATGIEDQLVVMGLASGGPARAAKVNTGDVIVMVAGREVGDLASFYRAVWSLGEAGVEVPLTLYREGRTFDVRITSADRADFLKRPSVH